MIPARRLAPLALLAILAALAVPSLPRADDVADARARFKAGAELYKARKYREAIEAFEAAYRLKPHGAIHFNVAQCRERLEEWPGALRSYEDYLREVPDAKDRATVRAAMGRLEARLAAAGVRALLVYSDPAGAELRIDGRVRGKTPLHITLPPATYRLAFALDGYEPVEREIDLGGSGSRVVDVVLGAKGRVTASAAAPATSAPAPSVVHPEPNDKPGAGPAPEARSRGAPPPTDLSVRAPSAPAPAALAAPPPARPEGRGQLRVYKWIAAGTAVAAAGAAAWFGLAANADRDKLLDGTARPDAARLADGARSKARTANILYVVSGAAAAAGATLFIVEGRF